MKQAEGFASFVCDRVDFIIFCFIKISVKCFCVVAAVSQKRDGISLPRRQTAFLGFCGH